MNKIHQLVQKWEQTGLLDRTEFDSLEVLEKKKQLYKNEPHDSTEARAFLLEKIAEQSVKSYNDKSILHNHLLFDISLPLSMRIFYDFTLLSNFKDKFTEIINLIDFEKIKTVIDESNEIYEEEHMDYYFAKISSEYIKRTLTLGR